MPCTTQPHPALKLGAMTLRSSQVVVRLMALHPTLVCSSVYAPPYLMPYSSRESATCTTNVQPAR